MSTQLSKAVLSCARRWLVELMQQLNHGRIENLLVRNGEPQRDPPPEVVRLVVFGKDNGPHVTVDRDSFVLKKHVTELFDLFDREQSILIRELVIGDGLPIRMSVADADRN